MWFLPVQTYTSGKENLVEDPTIFDSDLNRVNDEPLDLFGAILELSNEENIPLPSRTKN